MAFDTPAGSSGTRKGREWSTLADLAAAELHDAIASGEFPVASVKVVYESAILAAADVGSGGVG